jgi:hypothetical protein
MEGEHVMNPSDMRVGQRRPAAPPRLRHQRTLWAMRKVTGKLVTAAIYRAETGRELRVSYGMDDDVLETLVSSHGDAPLLARAAELRQKLDKLGWTFGTLRRGAPRSAARLDSDD